MTEAYYSPNGGGDMYVTENTTRHEDYDEPLISSEVVVGDDGVERTVTVLIPNLCFNLPVNVAWQQCMILCLEKDCHQNSHHTYN